MKQLFILLALMLSACTSVSITDGSQDMLVGTDRVQDGCKVKVDDGFEGKVTYQSERCNLVIEQTKE